MPGPWEKYAPPGSGPWQKYAKQESTEREQSQLRGGFANIPGATLDPAAHLASSAFAAPIAGLAGLGTAAARGLGLTDSDPADVIRSVQGALTFEPRTQAGAVTTEAITYPLRKFAEFTDVAGEVSTTAPRNRRAHLASGGIQPLIRPEYSPAGATAVNVGLQALPALFLRRGGKPQVTRGRSQETIAPRPQQANTTQTSEIRAQEYVARNTNLDWNSLSDAVRKTLTEIANDARVLERLDPAALERQARLESLPVPIRGTRGQLTRDPVQLRNEGNVSATTAGKPIRENYVAQNLAILQNLEVLKGRFRGKAETPEGVGLSVQDQALRAKLAVKKKEVADLYKKAEAAGELQGSAPTRSLVRLINETPDKVHLDWVGSWLRQVDVSTKLKGPAKKGTRLKASLKELEDLRQAAVARAMNGGTEGYYAGKVIRAIDEATEGAGGTAYKAARKARKEQALEFEEQGAVARLVENKSRTDRAVAVEDTWRKTVLGGSRADLEAVKRSLLTGGDTKTRAAGRQAWRDMQAETIRHIEREATKNVQRFEDGSPNVTPAAMERAIRSIGPEKLETLFGQGTVRRLNEIMEATRIVKTEPPVGFKGSPTFANLIAFLEKGLGRVPVIGDTAVGIVKAGIKLREMGREGRQVRESLETPMEIAAREAMRNALRK